MKTKITKKTIDMKIGDPIFMQAYWEKVDGLHPYDTMCGGDYSDGMSYDYQQENDGLRNKIRELHEYVGNAETKKKTIVFGHGISQLLAAAAFARCSGNNVKYFYMHKPFWPRIPTLLNIGAHLAGLIENRVHFVGSGDLSSELQENVCEVIVTPNNPTNEPENRRTLSKYDIHDLCYYWPQYTQITGKRDDDIMIFGLSKATGHAGNRFGWALVKSPWVANAMRLYVEYTTSGVSTDAQEKAFRVMVGIQYEKQEMKMDCFEYGRKELLSRWAKFKDAMSYHKEFQILNHSGLFAWCKISHPKRSGASVFFDKFNVVGAAGDSFGEDQTHFRLSLGVEKKDFNQLIERMTNDSAKTINP